MEDYIEKIISMIEEGLEISNNIINRGKKELIDEDKLISIAYFSGFLLLSILAVPFIILKLIFKIIKLKIKK